MVAMGPSVRGYLVKPESPPAPSVLLLVDRIDDAHRAEADGLARAGTVAFAVGPDSPTAEARAYLEGLPSTRGVEVRCRRAEGCP